MIGLLGVMKEWQQVLKSKKEVLDKGTQRKEVIDGRKNGVWWRLL